jgi:hypothetical protein
MIMSTSLKVQNYFKVLILLTVLLTNQVMGQNNVKKSLKEYTGTWSVYAKQSLEQMQKQKVSILIWRIHSIDVLKNEIEITQLGQRFDDGSEIKEPKKATYKIVTDTNGFAIILKGRQKNSKYKLTLSPLPITEIMMLSGTLERLDKKEENKLFTLGKTSEDTSVIETPLKKVEVVVQPPPPIE